MNKITTLVPLSEFVTETYKELLVRTGVHYKDHLELYAKLTKSYADFLSQPLELGFFVPCDDENNVLEEPDFLNASIMSSTYELDIQAYQKYKNKVLFEGFKLIGSDDDGIELELTHQNILITVLSTSISIQHYNGEYWEIKTIEEMFEFLKEYGLTLTLTEQAIKQIYG